MAEESVNLQTLEELILDEDKLVTYSFLSKKMCIHVNDSKVLLKRFAEKLKSNGTYSTINVTYLISGLMMDNKCRTTVCCETDIHKIRAELQSVFFEHIYSICKGPPNVDKVALLAVNDFSQFTSCLGLIKNEECIRLSCNEIENLKTQSHGLNIKKIKPNSEVKSLNTRVFKQDTKDEDVCKQELKDKVLSKQVEIKSPDIVKKEPVSPKKMAVSATRKNNKLQKGIAGFFNLQNGQAKKEVKIVNNVKKDEQIKESRTKLLPVQASDIGEISETMELDSPKNTCNGFGDPMKKCLKETELKKNKSRKSVTNIRKNAKVDNKRKRVLHVSDSESDEDKCDPFVKEETLKELVDSDDEIPPTPTQNTVKVTSGIINPKKKRKIIDKTYTDEEGYILTKKVEVYESCSDNEEASIKENVLQPIIKKEVSPVKKVDTKKSKKKVLEPQKGKQASIMSFFKSSIPK